MMAKIDKKSDNLGILSKIYHDDKTPQQRFSIIQKVRSYFNDPKKAEAWLSGAVLFLGALGIVFGIFAFKNKIQNPYIFPEPNLAAELAGQQPTEQDLLGLRQKDTDQDALSDYDELYVYHTSPYLPDSDSDGLDDTKEIARGSDPNCAIGQNCFAFIETEADNQPTDASLFVGSQSTATQLRQILKQSGMDPQVLDSMNDAELLAAYEQALVESGVGAQTASPTVDLPVNEIKNLTPDQIRQLLAEAGVGQDILSQVSDQELMDLVEETLKQQYPDQ
ncbi:MAG: hypothetical protein A3A24_02340 [Candidatus Buchananbacteria bacterium RIFCSPLOWO2_01_FULL_46_12]|uniref:Uncharacterized protein n=2 Tax=Candidatus Buchananiibacteriota TaxID=1817903 RepID=A0A1G1YNZ8_9BACT|nr:MAG: hypothetical protein A2744_00555 [Candidatus Buchananbacteria bacterium RIFCSPHIGHO2_01_FULL_44_11]OGY53536.1 MAG: hypothetical protein A3A24_02340 [Candidatus Buchananbacteria bacterium RIFCSPLOWO2_01_FULL_46_12]